MNKFLTFLATAFIAILGVFSISGNTKNAAEPQYFLENKEIQNAVVDKSTETNNIIDFYFDSNTEVFTILNETYNLLTLNENTEIYYYNEKNTLVKLNYNYSQYVNTLKFSVEEEENMAVIYFIASGFQIMKYNVGINTEEITISKNQWFILTDENEIFYNPKGIKIINFDYYENENLNKINDILSTYIGNLTELEQPTPTNSLNQIGNIISDTINWFVNIFSGLSNVFYNNGTLSVWGNVLFIGVAIYLVSMCLVWVISLIKGV